MANVGANNLLLGKNYNKKLCASDSVRVTASDYLLYILHLPFRGTLDSYHYAIHFIYLIYNLCGSLPSCTLMLYTYGAETVYHPDS